MVRIKAFQGRRLREGSGSEVEGFRLGFSFQGRRFGRVQGLGSESAVRGIRFLGYSCFFAPALSARPKTSCVSREKLIGFRV